MELNLTTPRGLYYVLLALTVVVEVVVGAVEAAQYFGVF